MRSWLQKRLFDSQILLLFFAEIFYITPVALFFNSFSLSLYLLEINKRSVTSGMNFSDTIDVSGAFAYE